MRMKDYFDAEPKSTWELFIEPGVGFYIPAYQREYSWDESNIERLFEDVIHGIQMLLLSEKKDAVTFIGALIVIHDIKAETVHPYVKGQLPSKVLLIIDGQQRLSTLLIMNSMLHEQLTIKANQLVALSDSSDQAIKWLIDEVLQTQRDLRKTLEEDKEIGEGQYRWYPRIIKAYEDQWSREEKLAFYKSPIAAFLHGYTSFSRENSKQEYAHQIPEKISETIALKHNIVLKNYVSIRDWLKKVANGSMEGFPTLDTVKTEKEFQESLLGQEIPLGVSALLKDEAIDPKDQLLRELLRLLIFARFLNHRVAVTLVTAKSEEYAFDMFEALNTTGTPLTAFETFKPRVIQSETLSEYETSISREHLSSIEGYLEQFTKAEDKQRATDRLLIPFALAETGWKLSKRLREQRTYLKLRFEELASIDEKRDFIRNLDYMSVFIRDVWPEKKSDLPTLTDIPLNNPDLVTLCLDVLRSSSHEIVIGLLARFFALIQESAKQDQIKAAEEFESVVKAVTAFWIFWRGIRRSTGGIDSRYRELMEKGNSVVKADPFSRRRIVNLGGTTYTYNPIPTSEKLKSILRHYLADRRPNIQTKEDWIRGAREIPFYQNVPNPITRFILLISTHDTYYDSSIPGLHIAARSGELDMLNVKQWRSNFTIEHIAPKDKEATGWDQELYDDLDLVHQIGNLTLLPPLENSIIGNKSWEHKRLLYQVISAPTEAQLNAKLKEAETLGLTIKENTANLLKNATYLPHIKIISLLNDPWSADFIRMRSERILELAWERLAPWLDIV